MQKFTSPKYLVIFLLQQLIGSISISDNCHVRVYESYMHKHFCFCSLTKFWCKCCFRTYWSCIHKCIGTCSRIYNQITNYLTDNCLYTEKKSSNMVLTFTVAQINICVKGLWTVSYLLCTLAKEHVAVNSTKTVVYIILWKLCTAVVHVDTE